MQRIMGGYVVLECLENKGRWYDIGNDGYMVSNTWVENYYVGADGAWIKETNVQAEYLEKYVEVLWGLMSDGDYERVFPLIYIDEDFVPKLFISDLYKINRKGTISFIYI